MLFDCKPCRSDRALRIGLDFWPRKMKFGQRRVRISSFSNTTLCL